VNRILYRLGHGGECIAWSKWTVACLLQLRDRRFCRPAARLFVQYAQSGMQLPETGSRRSRYPLSGSRMPRFASWTNSLAAARRTASVAQLQQTHDSSLTSAVHPPPCPKVFRSSHAHSPPLLLSSAEAVTTCREMAQSQEAYSNSNSFQCTYYGCVAYLEVAYTRNICEFEWSFRSRWRRIIKGKMNSAYRILVLRVACVFTGISKFRWMLFHCLQYL